MEPPTAAPVVPRVAAATAAADTLLENEATSVLFDFKICSIESHVDAFDDPDNASGDVGVVSEA